MFPDILVYSVLQDDSSKKSFKIIYNSYGLGL